MLKKSLPRRLLITAILWVVSRSSRVERINWHVIERLRAQRQPFLIGVWHCNVLSLIDTMGRNGFSTIVSRSRDGEDIAWVAARFGNATVRGSSAAGASAALRQALRMLAAREPVIVTPDGPRGPRFVVKSGIVALARKTGAPIVPVVCSSRRRWEFRSWDRMRLPKPFSRLTIVVGDPIVLAPAEADEETQRRRVEDALRGLLRRAEALTGADALFPDPALECTAAEAAAQAAAAGPTAAEADDEEPTAAN